MEHDNNQNEIRLITDNQAEGGTEADIEIIPELSGSIPNIPPSQFVNLPSSCSLSSGVWCDNTNLCYVCCSGKWHKLIKLNTNPSQQWRCNEIRNTPSGVYYKCNGAKYAVILR